jgi:hypothetical protein
MVVQVAGLAGDLEDLGGVGESELVDRDGLESADLDAAVAAVAGAVQLGDQAPGKALAAVQQGGLVGLDHEQVVRLLAGDQELGGLGVGLEGVGGDHDVGEVEWGQQRGEGGHLLRRAADLVLGQHRAAGVVHRRQQVHRAAVTVGWVGATQRLAVDRHRPPPAGSDRDRGPGPGRPARRRQQRRARLGPGGKGSGGWWPRRDGEVAGDVAAGASAARTGWGASAAHSAMAAIDRGAGQHRGGGQAQNGDQRVAPATGRSRVGDAGEVGLQVRGFAVLEGVGVGEVGQGGWDRG